MDLKEKVMGYDKKMLLIVLVTVVGAGVFFYAGAKYEKMKLSKLGLLGANCAQYAEEAKAARAITLTGLITAMDDRNVIIEMEDGSGLKTVPLYAPILIGKKNDGAVSDLQTGMRVKAYGKNNPDGNFIPANISKTTNQPGQSGAAK